MFAELINLFGGDNHKEVDETEVLRNKFKRIGHASTGSLPVTRTSDPLVTAPSHQRLIAHWTETAQAEIDHNNFYAAEPHVQQMLNNANTLLEPGSAEMFQSCKPHPLDELNARRRKDEEANNTRRFFQYSKRVKSA